MTFLNRCVCFFHLRASLGAHCLSVVSILSRRLPHQSKYEPLRRRWLTYSLIHGLSKRLPVWSLKQTALFNQTNLDSAPLRNSSSSPVLNRKIVELPKDSNQQTKRSTPSLFQPSFQPVSEYSLNTLYARHLARS